MFKYYKKIEVEEEMLFCKEIARKYKIFKVSLGGEVSKAAYENLVEIIIEEYIEKNNLKFEQLYYPTKSAFEKVYPKALYEPAMKEFLEIYKLDNIVQVYKHNEYKYRFMWFVD